MGERLNARLDDVLARKLERLKEMTGKSTSAILKAALESYYDRLNRGDDNPGAVLQRTGFIGCGSADADLSARYKDDLGASVGTKT